MSIELLVTTRFCRDMTEKLLKATLNPNKQQQQDVTINKLYISTLEYKLKIEKLRHCVHVTVLLSLVFCSEEERRRITKEMILKRKEKIRLGQKEPNILTWAARTQIRFLHAEDPYQWTPEVLAESFPVSKETIISILKQKRLPMDETEIEKHDQKVHRNWLKLKSELENRKEASQSLEGANKVDNRISKMINAAGIPSLPLPSQDEIVLTRKKLVEKLHPKVTGTFSAILSDYKAQFKLDDKDKIGIGDKPRKVAFAIGDQEAVQLLTTISTMNINETVSDADHGHDTMERLPESGSQQKSETEQDQSVSESEKSRQVISSLRQSRRQRRLRETTVTKENLDELQMQGTGKIS